MIYVSLIFTIIFTICACLLCSQFVLQMIYNARLVLLVIIATLELQLHNIAHLEVLVLFRAKKR